MQCAILTEQQGWFDGSWELQRRRTDKGPAVGAEGARADDEQGGNGELHLDCIYVEDLLAKGRFTYCFTVGLEAMRTKTQTRKWEGRQQNRKICYYCDSSAEEGSVKMKFSCLRS
jgi:hypothetical protein